MSAGGAMIEGSSLPDAGAMIQLVRGTLIVHGLVMWCSGNRCGLQFSGSVDVQQWRTCSTNVQQQRVDEVVRLVKAGAVPLPVPALGEPAQQPKFPGASEAVPHDLRRVSELLAQLGDELAANPEVILQHGTALQNLDIATQVVDAVRELITGHDDPDETLGRLAGLRRSADQALLR